MHVFPTFAAGGTQRRFASLANHFGRAYRHVIVAMDGITEAMHLLAPGLDVELMPIPQARGNTCRNLRAFLEILIKLRPDLLTTSNWGSIEWAMANLVTRVAHLHLEDGFGPEEAERQLKRRVWTRRMLLRGSTVVVPSQKLHDIATNVWRLPGSRAFYVPNGIDCSRFAQRPDLRLAADLGIRVGEIPVVGTVARLSREKNLGRLIDAFADVVRERPAVLAIVGDGPERASLEARATGLGIERSVVFCGDRRDPERFISLFTVFAISSDTEQMPLSVLEAMAAGVPIVATDVGDVRSMLAAENRPFVVPKSGPMLAVALLKFLNDPGGAAAVGKANAVRARAVFDQKIMFAQYQNLFDGKIPYSQKP